MCIRDSLEKNVNIISNFIQCEFWSNLKQTFDPSKIILRLYLFFDDYETGNPLGSHAGLNKVGAVYASIACLPPRYQSKLENIFTFLLFNTLDRKHLGNHAVLREAINELEFLEEGGITLNVDGLDYNLHFRFVLLLGDNLGLHTLLGFVESFRANFFCRICLINKSDMGLILDEDLCTHRNLSLIHI